MKFSAVAVLAIAALAAPASALAASAASVRAPATVSAPEIAALIPTARIAEAVGQAAVLRPRDLASDKTALNAYATYLTALVRTASLGQLSDSAYVTTIAGQCKGALEPLTQPNEQVNAAAQATLTALGKEMGDDLSIGSDQVALGPFLRLSTNLSRLRWTRLSGGAAIVRRFVTAENSVLMLSQSALCQNALLAASAPQTIPPATKSFIRGYARASNAANAALTNLLRLMQTYETPAERAVVTRIATLAAQLARLTKSGQLSNGSALTNTLEAS
jgi:hypothetical protein